MVGINPPALSGESFPVQTPDHFFPTLLFSLRLSGRKSPLTPIIPLHTRHSPVSPIIPVHTQKQGGWGHLSLIHLPSSLPSLPFPAHLPLSPTIPALTGTSPVSPIIPALTQPPGGRGIRHPFSCATGNCYPTSRTSSNMYHYITYQCRRADIFFCAPDTKAHRQECLCHQRQEKSGGVMIPSSGARIDPATIPRLRSG